MSICEQYYPEEPAKPIVKTESIPGPESQKQLKELGEVFDTRPAYFLSLIHI